MKNSKLKHATQAIIELSEKSHYQPLRNLFYCQDLLRLMPKNWQSMICKIFIHNDTLFILTKNSSGFQELNHDSSKSTLKVLINVYNKENSSSIFTCIKSKENIKVFMQKFQKPLPKFKKIDEKMPKFLELSDAKFKNPFENEILHQKFEALRTAILDARN